MSEQNTEEPTELDAEAPESNDSPEPEPADESSSDETESVEEDVFPRSVVEELRQENGKHRQRAQKAEQRLHVELVRATGRLADAEDLPFNAEHLDDAGALTAAIDELLARKPHLAVRRPTGDIGQGATKSATNVDLMAVLRGSG